MRCSIECPYSGANLMTKTGDRESENDLVYGYSRDVKSLTIPIVILNMLVQYYSIQQNVWTTYFRMW